MACRQDRKSYQSWRIQSYRDTVKPGHAKDGRRLILYEIRTKVGRDLIARGSGIASIICVLSICRLCLAELESFVPMHYFDSRCSEPVFGAPLMLCSQGNYDEAIQLYTRAITLGEKSLGPDHPDLAAWLQNMAQLWLRQVRAECHYGDFY